MQVTLGDKEFRVNLRQVKEIFHAVEQAEVFQVLLNLSEFDPKSTKDIALMCENIPKAFDLVIKVLVIVTGDEEWVGNLDPDDALAGAVYVVREAMGRIQYFLAPDGLDQLKKNIPTPNDGKPENGKATGQQERKALS